MPEVPKNRPHRWDASARSYWKCTRCPCFMIPGVPQYYLVIPKPGPPTRQRPPCSYWDAHYMTLEEIAAAREVLEENDAAVACTECGAKFYLFAPKGILLNPDTLPPLTCKDHK